MKNYAPEDSELGLVSTYDDTYHPDRLFPILRDDKRQEIGVNPLKLPFFGFDCWNHYEVSWLNPKGKPVVALAEIIYDCTSPCIIESKSLKLYFNSLNQTKINDIKTLEHMIESDIAARIQSPVFVKITPLNLFNPMSLITPLEGVCLDDLDIECSDYLVEPNYLKVGEKNVEETLYSHLLKSNCLVTNQPDWGSVQISYQGKAIDREGLLRYLVSFRHHNEFHEQCIERIFMDIMTHCKPESLTVYGRYTRRGGLDINPYRSTTKPTWAGKNIRLIRQ